MYIYMYIYIYIIYIYIYIYIYISYFFKYKPTIKKFKDRFYLNYCLFGSVKLTKSADLDMYKYIG